MTQPEALRLAEYIEEGGDFPSTLSACADELRRLHESNLELLAALKALSDADETDYIPIKIWIQARAAINKAERTTP